MIPAENNIKFRQIAEKLRQKGKIRVLFVCLGNICRSPAAEGVLQAIVDEHDDAARWTIDSAGTGNYHIGDLPRPTHACTCSPPRTGADTPLPSDCPLGLRGFRPDHRDGRAEPAQPPQHGSVAPRRRTRLWPWLIFFSIATRYDYVPDPYYEGAEGFELVLDLLQDACANLYNALTDR